MLGKWKNKAVSEEVGKKVVRMAHKPIKRRQKMLKEFMLLEILLGIIDFFWSNGIIPREVTEERVSKDFKHPYNLCKECHELIRMVVENNKTAVTVLVELGSVNVMLQ